MTRDFTHQVFFMNHLLKIHVDAVFASQGNPPVATTAASVNSNFASSINNTGSKFAKIPVANNGNNIRLITPYREFQEKIYLC